MPKYLDENGLNYFWEKLKSVFAKIDDISPPVSYTFAWTQGGINASGVNISRTTRIRSAFIPIESDLLSVSIPSGCKYCLHAYDSSKVHLGYIPTSSEVLSALRATYKISDSYQNAAFFRIWVAYTDDSNILPAVGDEVQVSYIPDNEIPDGSVTEAKLATAVQTKLNKAPLIEDVTVTVTYSAGTIGSRGAAVAVADDTKTGYTLIGYYIYQHSNSSTFNATLMRNSTNNNITLTAYRATGNAASNLSVTVRLIWLPN